MVSSVHTLVLISKTYFQY